MSDELENACRAAIETNSIEDILKYLRSLLLGRLSSHSHTDRSRVVKRIQNGCYLIDRLIVHLHMSNFGVFYTEIPNLKIATNYCIHKTDSDSDEYIRRCKTIVARLSTAAIELAEKQK